MAFGRKPKPMNELLREFMKKVPQQTELKRGMALHLYPEIVGERIATATKGLKFDGPKLIITVSSEAWRFELHANRFSITKRINEKVGSKVVKEIIVRS